MSYTKEEAQAIAQRLLFPHLIDVAGVHAPKDLLLPCLTKSQRKDPEPLSGIYCQFRYDGKNLHWSGKECLLSPYPACLGGRLSHAIFGLPPLQTRETRR